MNSRKLVTLEYHTTEKPDEAYFLHNLQPISLNMEGEKDGTWKVSFSFVEVNPTILWRFKQWLKGIKLKLH